MNARPARADRAASHLLAEAQVAGHPRPKNKDHRLAVCYSASIGFLSWEGQMSLRRREFVAGLGITVPATDAVTFFGPRSLDQRLVARSAVNARPARADRAPADEFPTLLEKAKI